MNQKLSFIATGDSFITRRKANKAKDSPLVDLIKKAEFRFTNLEVTVHDFEGYPGALSGGTWAVASPTTLEDLQSYAFNCLTWCNNHTLDYLYGGLEATEKNLNDRGFVHAGVGKNLHAAAAPKYIECPNGRVALIGATSTFHDFWRAGKQREDLRGRPGINPLRFDTTYYVNKNRLQQLTEIAKVTNINAETNLAIKEGFALKGDSFHFGSYSFKESENEGMIRRPHMLDMNRIISAIHEASRQADYVVVSIHCHEMDGERKEKAPDFLEEFSKRCIDEGAHAIIGHGPHILRGIEIYKKRPIFYSLGNFIFQNDTVASLPHDFYEQYGMKNGNVADALDVRSAHNTKGLGTNKKVWHSVIPYWEMENGQLTHLSLFPIDLGFGLPRYKRGWPRLTESEEALKEIQALSIDYNTKIDIQNGIGNVRL
ncbi:capsule biosynthesis protein [Halalkalibacter wakoensis JCM 9140]|uniref:Capsule biosynthesis protein n=1 Tax=Halalkalibacter wakoensis JCM 9140 TaxID=1236970 RepID=W4Q871_9BACI|nr:CapA family protein [Halalkalibacter wakoensis]GAE27569.1 capsule biosynthesis protein [Halalkalibacter wakoensis JCM 9140]